jgi:hypothetical protein
MLSIDRLRDHQKHAVNKSIDNKFSSGVHFPKKCLGYIIQDIIGIEGYGVIKTEEPLIIECKFDNQLNAF